MFSISQASRAISAWKKARWDLEETKAPTPMATAPAIAAAIPPRAMVRTSLSVAVTPARKPMVEITPSFRPKMTSRTRRPWGVCQASSWKRLSGSASQVTGGGEAGRPSGLDAIGLAPGRRPYRLQALAGKGFSTSKPEFHLDIRALQRYSPPDFFEWKSGGLGRRGEMAVYTVLDKRELAEVVEDHGLVKLLAAHGVAAGSVNTTYLLETARGKHLLRVDEVKGELEVKRELDLLLFLRKHGFPCPQPIADRKGHHYREAGGKCLSVYRYYDGHVLRSERISAAQLENIGRVLADLHTIGKSYKKGIENRFSFERVASLYGEVRGRLPSYFKRIVRTLDDEVDYLQNYLETKLPKGIIHGDLFHDNLIVKGDKVVAVLDFEAASRGKFVFDLATAVNALRFTGTRLRDFFLNPVDDQLRVNKDFRDFYERLRILRRERDGGMEGLLMAMATGYDYRKYQKVKALEKKGSK